MPSNIKHLPDPIGQNMWCINVLLADSEFIFSYRFLIFVTRFNLSLVSMPFVMFMSLICNSIAGALQLHVCRLIPSMCYQIIMSIYVYTYSMINASWWLTSVYIIYWCWAQQVHMLPSGTSNKNIWFNINSFSVYFILHHTCTHYFAWSNGWLRS